jgi:TonB family protein
LKRAIAGALLLICACATPPAPVAPPQTPAPPAPAPGPVEEAPIGSVRVTASALNVRREPSASGEVVTQVKQGETLSVLAADESWTKVRLADGSSGWVATRFVSSGAAASRSTSRSASKPKARQPRRGGCPADSDYAFVQTPRLAFSDRGGHGLVVVEATVNASGNVTSTKVVSNGTGDEALGLLAEREIKTAKFSPPIRNCVARSFIFTYRRTF